MQPNLEKIKNLCVHATLTVKETLKRMDEVGAKILFVVNPEQKLLGSVTDGDIRRWILREGSLQEAIHSMYHSKPKYVEVGYDVATTQTMMLQNKIEALPIVDKAGILVDVLFWNDLFSGEAKHAVKSLNVPVLVMAGGRGTRLDPFTKILPKPLIPIGEKPVVEVILDSFADFGCADFYLTLNYKGKMVQSYFENSDCKHRIQYLWEEVPCGTAGSLSLAFDVIDAPHLFVSNCDILVKADYLDFFNFHLSNNNDITLIGSMQHFAVPYGVIEMKNGGALDKIVEKPEYDFLVSTGMYLIKKEVISLIPSDAPFDFPDLIGKVKQANGKVGVYPVSQQSWLDMGQWQEYRNAIKGFEK